MLNPYTNLSAENFWKTGAEKQHPLTIKGMYTKKFSIDSTDKIVTAGSCFAQHISAHLKKSGYTILDTEVPIGNISESLAKRYGYKLYSARYGNIYYVRQLLQLVKEAISGFVNEDDLVWKGENGKFYDSMRPTIEPEGLKTGEEVIAHRKKHIDNVKKVFTESNIFIFTLGLTEAWVNIQSGRVYPLCPGTVAGTFDSNKYKFVNFDYGSIEKDLLEFIDLVKSINHTIKFILTVSPVPLTATATDEHVIVATVHSKSILRAVAGSVAKRDDVDYFPSYEIISSHWSKGFFYESNMRSVNSGGVETVMRVFSEQHPPLIKNENNDTLKNAIHRKDNTVCDEILLEAFSK